MRESADAKAKRLLVERRVRIIKADARGIWAYVRGDSATYESKWEKRGAHLIGTCNCAAVGERCSHLGALRHLWTGDSK